MDARELMETIAVCADKKKAMDMKVLQIGELTTLADYFVVCSGTSYPHMSAIAEEIEDKLSEAGVQPRGLEGKDNPNWILLDYGDVIVHIFNTESREFYSIERLWSDAREVNLEQIKGNDEQ